MPESRYPRMSLSLREATNTLRASLHEPRQSVAAWRAARSERGLAAVSAVPVGLASDGLALRSAGAPIDKSWGDLLQELTDARAAWQQNPLARRIVGLTTSYTVGHGITLQSPYRPLQRFIDDFWQHNHMGGAHRRVERRAGAQRRVVPRALYRRAERHERRADRACLPDRGGRLRRR